MRLSGLTLVIGILIGLAVGLLIGAGSSAPGEVVCDNVEFVNMPDVPYAKQAQCNAGFTVTLLD